MSMNEKYIIFSIGEEIYAVNILNITSIEDYQKPVPVHGSPGFISGIINLRGDIIPVINMRYVFGCPPREEAAGKLLIADIGDVRLAFLVDDVTEIYSPSDGNLKEIPKLVKCPATEYADGVIDRESKIVIVISPDKVLTKAELGEIDKILEDMQEEIEMEKEEV